MKKNVAMAAVMLLTVSAFAQDVKSIYNKYSDGEDVSAVFVSPAMFRMMGKLPEMDICGSDMDLAPLISSFNGLYMIDSENVTVNKSLKPELESLVKKSGYELMLEAKDDGETVRIYTLGQDVISSFMLLTYEQNEFTFICIDGKIKREDIAKLIAMNQ